MESQMASLAPAGSKLKTAIAALLVLIFTLGTIGPSVWADGTVPAPATADISVKASNLIPPPPTQLAAAKFHANFADPAITTVVDKMGKMGQPTSLKPPRPRARNSTLSRNEKPQSPYLAQAWRDMQSGDNLAAQRSIDRALADAPDATDVLNLKAYILARMNRHDDAVETLCRLLEIEPDNAEALRNLALELGQSTRSQALKELEDMASADPSSASVQAALARQYMRKRAEGKALAALDRAARLAPQNIAYRIELASFYDRYGYPSEAATLYRQAAETASARKEADSEDDPAITQDLLRAIRNRADFLLRSALRARQGAPNAPLPDASLPDE